MPKSPEDATIKDVLYPDDLPGKGFETVEYAYYDADDDDDAEELPDEAQYGLWLPCMTPVGADEKKWVSAPRGLREALLEAEYEEGEPFRVLEVDRGPDEHDPYEIEIEYPYQP